MAKMINFDRQILPQKKKSTGNWELAQQVVCPASLMTSTCAEIPSCTQEQKTVEPICNPNTGKEKTNKRVMGASQSSLKETLGVVKDIFSKNKAYSNRH